jgi:hypothetical protein
VVPRVVVRACGHKQGIADLEKSPCRGCVNAARRLKSEAKRAAWEAKQGSRWMNHPPSPAGRDDREVACRYPAGAVVSCSWNGRLWRVRLDLPDGRFLVVESPGVHTALSELWQRWRSIIGAEVVDVGA